MVRLRMVVAAGCALALAAGPAMATPFVGTVGQATGVVHLLGTDGRPYVVDLSLVAVTPVNAPTSYSLRVSVGMCGADGCKTGSPFVRVLSDAEVTASEGMSSVAVTSSFMGSPLRTTWSLPAGDHATLPSAQVVGPGVNFQGGGGAREADVRVTVVGAICQVVGQVVSDHVVASDGYAGPSGARFPARLAAQFAPTGTKRVTCARTTLT